MTALETDDCDHYIKTHGRKTATHHSALWICKALAQTVGEPSKDFARWQLAVKRGAE